MKKIILNIALFLGIALSVTAQNVYIPDANFKAYLVGRTDSINTNNDTVISVQEAEGFSGRIDVSILRNTIKSIVGVEAFKNITYLNCSYNDLQNIDVSKNIKLTWIKCSGTQLTTLNLSNNIHLKWLDLYHCQLTNINISRIRKGKTKYK